MTKTGEAILKSELASAKQWRHNECLACLESDSSVQPQLSLNYQQPLVSRNVTALNIKEKLQKATNQQQSYTSAKRL